MLLRVCGPLMLALITASAAQATPLQACRVPGIANEVQCGVVKRPLDPAKPKGVQIDVHYVVVPAMARNKQPDPVLMLAGGPGQSAIDVAPIVISRLSRLGNRRDVVLVDQRGTGKSAPLMCADDEHLSMKDGLDPELQAQRLDRCREKLMKLPYGDLRQFTTTIAMQDMDAVREQLGADKWNLVGGSYGTRAALEYLRQFPQHVRRVVIDGVAPPDMVLPASFSTDNQAALDAELQACEKQPACAAQYPQLRNEWTTLLKSLPHAVSAINPETGLSESFLLDRTGLLSLVRAPLYAPALAAALPAAIHAASLGRFDGLIGLSSSFGGKVGRIAAGMHYSVVCAEDIPRMTDVSDQPGKDFGHGEAQRYLRACKDWPRGVVPAAFYTIPKSASPVLLLSGGADPATPPRHAERVAKALGPLTLQVVVPESGHGVMGVGCMRDVIFRFIDAKTDVLALQQDASCATKIPRPPAFIPPQPAVQTGKDSAP